MKPTRLLLLASTALLLAACDFVRFPGDGGPTPETPDAGPAVPPGAPGPPPPSVPVDDPYGTGDDTGSDDEPLDDAGDAGTVPDAGLDGDPEPDTPTDDTPATDTDMEDPSGSDTPDSGNETPPQTGDEDSGTPDGDADNEDPDTGVTDPDGSDPDPAPDTPADEPDDTASLPDPVDPTFSFYEAGALLPGTGQGAPEQIAYAPDIVFPIADAPAYLQSQVFSFGGGVAGGDQCDTRNYAYPWRDNFCEVHTSNRNSPYCPLSKVHQGQDIRVGTAADCNTLRRTSASDRTLHKVVAVEDGIISHVGTYSVNLRAGGRIYKYMHMNMAKLQVKAGDPVEAGQHIGYVSNDFGGTPTTFHLHFEITQNVGDAGWVHVPPYLSLAEAYERREGGPGEVVEAAEVGVATTPFIIPEGMEIIE